MFKLKSSSLLISLMLIISSLTAQSIERIEPPFWWRDMQDNTLQLMVYGPDIASTDVSVNSDVIKLVATHRLTSPNYIFLDLNIMPGASRSVAKLTFSKNGQEVASQDYVLEERRPGSSDRIGFGNSDVMYLITPDRFANGDTSNDQLAGMREGYNRTEDFGRHGGDIEGIRQHLDYINQMGFTAIWINPMLENDQDKYSYHGYSVTDYYKVDPRYGSNEDYVELSKEAKSKGIKMIMDVIANHCGSFHWWMSDLPSQDWIHQPFRQTSHRKATLLDPYGAPEDREAMVQGWFVKSMPDLNQRNPFMSKYLIQNSIWWIEYADLDGLRQDTYSYPYRDFMTDWSCAIMNEYPNFNIVGEEWVLDPAMISYWQRDKTNSDHYSACLPSLMDFPMTTKLHEALKEDEGRTTGLIKLYETLTNDYLYPHPEDLVIFPDNHDMSRILTQVNEDVDLAKMAVVYILTTRGTPQIYYGTEILMSNPGTDSHGVIRSDFPGGWQGDSVNAFNGDNLSGEAIAMQNYMSGLLNWRKNKAVIHHGELMHYVPENSFYVYFRTLDNEKVMVVLNKNTDDTKLALDRFERHLKDYQNGVDIISGRALPLGDSLAIPARSAMVLELGR